MVCSARGSLLSVMLPNRHTIVVYFIDSQDVYFDLLKKLFDWYCYHDFITRDQAYYVANVVRDIMATHGMVVNLNEVISKYLMEIGSKGAYIERTSTD